jgi:hypothetical protein
MAKIIAQRLSLRKTPFAGEKPNQNRYFSV